MIRRPRCVAFVRWTGDCVSKVPEISGPYVHLTAQATRRLLVRQRGLDLDHAYVHLTAQATRRLLAVRSATLGATGGAVMAKGAGFSGRTRLNRSAAVLDRPTHASQG